MHHFARLLPAHGVQPIILTADPSRYEPEYLDESLLAEIPAEVRIIRTHPKNSPQVSAMPSQKSSFQENSGKKSWRSKIKDAISRRLIPDYRIPWVLSSIRTLRSLRSEGIEAVIASAPPYSGHLLGIIAARILGVPLILDYRDLWMEIPFFQSFNGPIYRSLSRWVEWLHMRLSDLIMFTTDSAMKQQIKGFHLRPEKCLVLENGFDGEVFERLKGASHRSDVIRFSYLGSMTKERTPEYFLKALSKFSQRYPDTRLEVNVYGAASADLQEAIGRQLPELGLEGVVHFRGLVSKDNALDVMVNQSEVLLILQPQSLGGLTAVSSKVYEYLAAGRPILTMHEGEGETKNFLKQLGVPYIAEYADVDAIAQHIEKMVLDYDKVAEAFLIYSKGIAAFDRRRLVERLASLLKTLRRSVDGGGDRPH